MQTALQAPKKANLSLKVDLGIKSDLQKIAKSQSRSVHYVLIEAVERYINEQKAEADYQEYVKNRVMQAYNRMQSEGSKGVTSDILYSRLNAKMTQYAQGKNDLSGK